MAVMSDEARAKRAEYMRQWRKKNPDKQREYKRRYWERKAERGQGEEWQQGEKTSA